MPDDLRWSLCHNHRNKVHNKCNVLESSWNHPSHPALWGKSVFHKNGPWCQKGWGPLLYRIIEIQCLNNSISFLRSDWNPFAPETWGYIRHHFSWLLSWGGCEGEGAEASTAPDPLRLTEPRCLMTPGLGFLCEVEVQHQHHRVPGEQEIR